MGPASSEELGRRLREARQRSGLSQAAAAHKLGMRRPSLSEIEHGRREVRALELEGLADLYQVSTRLLTYGVGPKHEQLVRLVADVLTPLHSQDLDLLARAIQIVKARRA